MSFIIILQVKSLTMLQASNVSTLYVKHVHKILQMRLLIQPVKDHKLYINSHTVLLMCKWLTATANC